MLWITKVMQCWPTSDYQNKVFTTFPTELSADQWHTSLLKCFRGEGMASQSIGIYWESWSSKCCLGILLFSLTIVTPYLEISLKLHYIFLKRYQDQRKIFFKGSCSVTQKWDLELNKTELRLKDIHSSMV